jgi:hypothetical protein
VFKLSSSITANTLINVCKQIYRGMDLTKHRKFPFLIDLSGDTGTSELDIIDSGTSSNAATQNTFVPLDIYIKLPSTRSVKLFGSSFYTESMAADYLNLTENSWEYLATNAPSVSSKTIKIGTLYDVYNDSTLVTYLQPRIKSALDTLVTKGWTLAKGT